MPRKKATFLAPAANVELVFGPELIARAQALCDVAATALPHNDPATVKAALRGVEIVLSTWGMPRMTPDILDAAPDLRVILYGASSVKGFVTEAVYDRGITVTTAALANATAVAEFTVALITLSLKNAWAHLAALRREGRRAWRRADLGPSRGTHRAVVGIIGASATGRETIRLLKSYTCPILVADPFLTLDEARTLGVEKTELDDLIARSDVVSLHAPNLPHLRHMIGATQLRCMRDGAVFINTARGALVDEEALVAELRTGRLLACLDVTDPEPPAEGSPLYSLPNVILTPHLAGATGADCRRMGELCIQELERYLAGLPPLHPVTRERLPFTS
ncbi:MAG TPA: hydroxyacid dehydrogenase [Planctomycetota bacterium]|nr:hydroxyacid dehydrogenase [Planctomycetota bacterium]HRR80939.1 hydroxyacid dehydrogenase [Planctomycetota bacterium]HRT93762.1 hydroxyacid dehydrogenase [Planctomycetota bacterium]